MCQHLCVQNADWETAAGVLRLATQLVDGIQDGLARRGFSDVRPAHGFAFVRIADGDATTADVAHHLGVTKQAASQLVEQLVDRGYVLRTPDTSDRRARRLLLTDRGRMCTRAAEEAAAETVSGWAEILDSSAFVSFSAAVAQIAVAGRLRPAW